MIVMMSSIQTPGARMTSMMVMTAIVVVVVVVVAALLLSSANALSVNKKPSILRKIRSVVAPFTLPWYEDGLSFHCTSCGKCCKVDGDVWLAPEEVRNIMEHLGYYYSANDDDNDDGTRKIEDKEGMMEARMAADFRKKYIRAEISPEHSTNDHHNNEFNESWMCLKRKEGACIFLDQNNGQCKIYEARPMQCSTYPFWPSLLTDPEAWEEESVLPDSTALREGTNDRHWSPELGGCEGIITMNKRTDEIMTRTSTNEIIIDHVVVDRIEIQSKMKKAAQHWKRFPVQEIKESTWYL